MGDIRSFRDLEVWSAAMTLVASAYQLIRKLPAAEMYGLSAQMRRAAVSIPSNIAEGHAGGRGARYRHHVRIALGSLAELDTHLEIAVRLGFLSPPERATAAAQLTRTRQLLHGLARSLEREKAGPRPTASW